eukprot:gene19371-26021_t
MFLSCFGLNKKSVKTSYLSEIGRSEELPGPPPGLLLSIDVLLLMPFCFITQIGRSEELPSPPSALLLSMHVLLLIPFCLITQIGRSEELLGPPPGLLLSMNVLLLIPFCFITQIGHFEDHPSLPFALLLSMDVLLLVPFFLTTQIGRSEELPGPPSGLLLSLDIGLCEELPSPPPGLLLSMDVMLLKHSDRGLSFSALSQTKKAVVEDEHISSALHAHYSEVDLSCYSETDFAFDQLEGGRVEAPEPAVDYSSVLSEVCPFSEKEGDNLNGDMDLNGDNLKMTNGDGDNLNGDMALNSDNLNITNGKFNMTNGNGDMALNSDNLKMINICSEGVGCGCTEHVSDPLDTKPHRLVPRHLSTSALDTRVRSQRVLIERGFLHSAGSHNSTLVDERRRQPTYQPTTLVNKRRRQPANQLATLVGKQRRHETQSCTQKPVPVELQKKYKRLVSHTAKRLDLDHQKEAVLLQTAFKQNAIAILERAPLRQGLAQRCLITASLDTSKYQQHHMFLQAPSSGLRSPSGKPHMAPHGLHMASHGSHVAPPGSHLAPTWLAHGSHMARTWPRDLYNSLQQLDATESCSSSANSSCVLAQSIHKHSGTAQVTPGRPGW